MDYYNDYMRLCDLKEAIREVVKSDLTQDEKLRIITKWAGE